MILEKFYASVNNLHDKISETQTGNIKKAAQLMTDSIANGGAIHIFDSGHMISHELLSRAGGPMLYNRLQYGISVDSTSRNREEPPRDKSMVGLAEYALKASKVIKGDILFIGSVSGISIKVVDLAVAAKAAGITIIAITALEYSTQLKSLHPCDKKLYELADLTIDNCAPFGDAMIEITALDQFVCPASGLAAAFIMWAISADLIETMLDRGLTPSIFKSTNFPEFKEFNVELRKVYAKRGY